MAVLLGHRLSEKFLKPAEMMKDILFCYRTSFRGGFSGRTGGTRFMTYQDQPVGASMYVLYLWQYAVCPPGSVSVCFLLFKCRNQAPCICFAVGHLC